ncbi:hypothetical protein [Gimesia maris]|uniref:DUF433 domain-containing protein n=2 Tax=Gimesia maris TaxID=122 RepID=A0ABX5YMF0_9PLAN|nr:hypothetical protein [Gimesia maris]QEG16798.1 hypothetical protein GmarT_26660 [Gimesia maris]QGQ30049.1 hypothetical protein F1729_16145 [Gimesia maris]
MQKTAIPRWFKLLLFLISLSLLQITVLAVQKTETPPREQIGTCLGKPVYRDQIGISLKLSEELQLLFSYPVFSQFHQEHQAKFKPTEKEIAAAIAYYSRDESVIKDCQEIDKLTQSELEENKNQLKRSDLKPAERKRLEQKQQQLQRELKNGALKWMLLGMLEYWKFEKHLYLTQGGGRIRSMMFGEEAFDARFKWLEAQEKRGKFQITDPQLRTTFFEFWTDKNNRGYNTTSQESIQEFLEPQWQKELNADKPLTAKKP